MRLDGNAPGMEDVVVSMDTELLEDARRVRSSAAEHRIVAHNSVVAARATIERSRLARADSERVRIETGHGATPAPTP